MTKRRSKVIRGSSCYHISGDGDGGDDNTEVTLWSFESVNFTVSLSMVELSSLIWL